MVAAFSVVVMGDILAELVARLGDVTFESLTEDALVYTPIELGLGGSAIGFALAAKPLFERVGVLGRVGSDPLGEFTARELRSAGISMLGPVDSSARTGTAVYVRDASSQCTHGVRLLLVDAGANGPPLSETEYDIEVLEGLDLLFTDGYASLDEGRAGASRAIVELASARGAVVAFDLVPHTVFETRDFAWLTAATRHAEVVIAEARTLGGFLGRSCASETQDEAVVLDIAAEARSVLGRRAYFLRYGFGNIDRSTLVLPSGETWSYTTGYRDCEHPRGFGDLLSARELRWYLEWRESGAQPSFV